MTFIQNNLKYDTVVQLCTASKFPKSTYYKALLSVHSNRQKEYEAFGKKVKQAFDDSKGRYSAVKICRSLNDSGTACMNVKNTEGDTGHAEIDMITKVYAHILDEDRKINAQKFESALYSNPDLRNIKPPQEQPQVQSLDLSALIEQLQKSPELANTLAALISSQKVS